MKKTNFGFCMERGEKCGYCGGKKCEWEKDHFSSYTKCFNFTNDSKRILKSISDLEVLEIIGKQIVEEKGKELDLILETCYFDRNRESALEHLKRNFFEEYGMRNLYKE